MSGAVPVAVPHPYGFGRLILARRLKLGLSLQDVADRATCSKAHVWALEQGTTRNPCVGLIAGLSQALNLPAVKLFKAALPAPEPLPEGHEAVPPTSTLPTGE